MKVASLIQARSKGVNSEGYPTNALEEVKGKPLLWHLIERVKRAKKLDEIVVVTTGNEEDKVILEIAKECNVRATILSDDRIYRTEFGGRPYYYYGIDCPKLLLEIVDQIKAEIILSIKDDLYSFIDTETIDRIISSHLKNGVDITNNMGILGIDYVAGVSPLCFKRIYDKSAKEIREKEHALGHLVNGSDLIQEYSSMFKVDYLKSSLINANTPEKIKRLKLDVTTKSNLIIVKEIYDCLYQPGKIIEAAQVVGLLKNHPEIYQIPVHLSVELTNDCTLGCIMCPHQYLTREKKFMDIDLFEKVLKETVEIGVQQIDFELMGEPLLHSEFPQILKMAKDKMVDIGIYTNGVNLTEEIARAILDYNVKDIIINLPATTQETYRNITGKDDFQKVIANTNDFLKLKKEKVARMEKNEYGWWSEVKPVVGLQILKIKETDHEIEGFMNEWDWMDKIKKMIDYENRVQKELEVNTELWETFYTKALPIEHAIIGHFNRYCDQIEDRGAIDVTPLKRFPCRQLENSLSILCNGDVIVCQQDFDGKFVIGNFRDSSLMDIWESQELKDLRSSHFKGDYDKHPLCANCKEWYIP